MLVLVLTLILRINKCLMRLGQDHYLTWTGRSDLSWKGIRITLCFTGHLSIVAEGNLTGGRGSQQDGSKEDREELHLYKVLCRSRVADVVGGRKQDKMMFGFCGRELMVA